MAQTPMRHRLILRAVRFGLWALVCVVGLAGAQQLRLDDTPSTEPPPETYQRLPLTDAQQATLRSAVESRQYARAEDLLAAEAERQPKSQPLLTTVASIFFLDGKYLNCAVALKKAEALAPLTDRQRFTLALSYIVLNHRDWARPELEKLAAADSENPLYPYWLGRIDYDAMHFKAAVAHLQKALELSPTFMKAYDNLGLAYEGLGQYDEAIRVYQKAVDMNHSVAAPSPWLPLNLGTLLVKLEKLDEAKPYLEESLKYDPRFPKAHYQMGLLLEKQKNDDAALHELEDAAHSDPAYAEPHYLMGRIYTRRGEKSKADAEWQTFQKLKAEAPQERPH